MADHTIAKGEGNLSGMRTVNVPSNLEQVGGKIGHLASVLGVLAPATGAGVNLGGGWNQDATKLIGSMTFAAHPRPSGINTTLRVQALRREDRTVDVVIRASNAYTPGYREDDEATLRGLYQDLVAIRIQPIDPYWKIAQHAIAPITNVSEVNYQVTTNWGAEGGFEANLGKTPGIGASGGASYSFQVTSGTVTKDFDLEKQTSNGNAISWRSKMRNSYHGNQADSTGYNFQNPYSLVVNGAATKWFKDVPSVAKADMNLEYQAAYYASGAEVGRTAQFEVVSAQRLIYGQVVGRTGAKGLRTGGSAIMTTVHVISSGTIDIDFETGNVAVSPRDVMAYGIQDFGRPEMDQKVTEWLP